MKDLSFLPTHSLGGKYVILNRRIPSSFGIGWHSRVDAHMCSLPHILHKACDPEMLGERENEILSRELARLDPSFRNFLYVVNFASVYRYDDEWGKLDIEGTFVMYARKEECSIGIRVFNRRSLQDFALNIRRDTRVGIGTSLITLQNKEDEGIYGLWFHNDTHPRKILDCLRANM